MGKGNLKFHIFCIRIDLFCMYVLFSQCEVCGSTLENCFFQISLYLNIYMPKGKIMSYLYIYIKKGKFPWDLHGVNKTYIQITPLLGKQNIQAKEVYRNWEGSPLHSGVYQCICHTLQRKTPVDKKAKRPCRSQPIIMKRRAKHRFIEE